MQTTLRVQGGHTPRIVCLLVHGGYYYTKNRLNSTGTVDLFIRCENDKVCGYETGYVVDYCFKDGIYLEVESNGLNYLIKEEKRWTR